MSTVLNHTHSWVGSILQHLEQCCWGQKQLLPYICMGNQWNLPLFPSRVHKSTLNKKYVSVFDQYIKHLSKTCVSCKNIWVWAMGTINRVLYSFTAQNRWSICLLVHKWKRRKDLFWSWKMKYQLYIGKGHSLSYLCIYIVWINAVVV